VSPILIRPVREQLEHDRVIRLLQARLRRRFEVAVNLGAEQTAPLRAGRMVLFPDLVLYGSQRGRKLLGLVEVETAESVNNLEAMAQWVHFGRLRLPFSLYVPAGSVDIARRLCADHQMTGVELWGYHAVGGQVRFTLVQRAQAAGAASGRSRAKAPGTGRGRKPASRRPARSGKRSASGRKPARKQKRK